MNERQRRFAHEYVKTGVLAEAARNAGYPDTEHAYAGKHGHRLMKNDEIREFIDELLAESDIANEITPNAIATGIIREAKTADRAADRLRGYELLGKAQGMFRDVQERRETPEIGALLEQIKSISPKAAQALAADLGIALLEGESEVDSQQDGTNTDQPIDNVD